MKIWEAVGPPPPADSDRAREPAVLSPGREGRAEWHSACLNVLGVPAAEAMVTADRYRLRPLQRSALSRRTKSAPRAQRRRARESPAAYRGRLSRFLVSRCLCLGSR